MLRWVTILATAGMIAVNSLANALPIGGNTTGDIADGFDIAFTPAGYVFSIWGLIYLLLCGFSGLQAVPSRTSQPLIEKIRPWYLLNTAANATWIFAWHYEQFGLSLGIMAVILVSLVGIYRELRRHPRGDALEMVLVRAPFSIYLGWISVAIIANTTVVLWVFGIQNALTEPSTTLVLVGGATAICTFVSLRFADPIYAAVFVWAIIGIAMKHSEEPTLFIGALCFAAACAVVAGVSTVAAIRRARTPA